MRWYRALGAASALAACIYYYLDYRADDESVTLTRISKKCAVECIHIDAHPQLNATIRDLGAANPSAVDRALNKLDSVRKRGNFGAKFKFIAHISELVRNSCLVHEQRTFTGVSRIYTVRDQSIVLYC
jgi:hypothetical protein